MRCRSLGSEDVEATSLAPDSLFDRRVDGRGSVALAVAALRASTPAWAGAMLMLVWSVLGLAIICAVYRPRGERAWWLGFALFGCGYLVLAFWSEINFDSLPTTTLLLFLSSKVDPSIQQAAWSRTGELHWTFLHIAHCLWGLVAAVFGGAAANMLSAAAIWIASNPSLNRPHLTRCPRLGGGDRRSCGLQGRRWSPHLCSLPQSRLPGLWAGVVFLLTCGMLGLATLGALARSRKAANVVVGGRTFRLGLHVLHLRENSSTIAGLTRRPPTS